MRVICHIDLDAFYVQVERTLQRVPLGPTEPCAVVQYSETCPTQCPHLSMPSVLCFVTVVHVRFCGHVRGCMARDEALAWFGLGHGCGAHSPSSSHANPLHSFMTHEHTSDTMHTV